MGPSLFGHDPRPAGGRLPVRPASAPLPRLGRPTRLSAGAAALPARAAAHLRPHLRRRPLLPPLGAARAVHLHRERVTPPHAAALLAQRPLQHERPHTADDVHLHRPRHLLPLHLLRPARRHLVQHQLPERAVLVLRRPTLRDGRSRERLHPHLPRRRPLRLRRRRRLLQAGVDPRP